MVIAKLMKVFGIPMFVAISVRNGRRWTSGQQSTRNGASPRSMKFGKKTMKAERQSVQGFQNWIVLAMCKKEWGTHLRELRKKQPKLKDGKSVKGSKHRLTNKTLEKLQTYYGNAIRANVKPGKLTPQEQKKQIKIMQKAILAVLYHTCELPDDKKRHQYSPPGPDSWCSCRRDGTLQRKDHHLDAVFLDFLLPEFQHLSEYSLLLRCLPGYSQNVNESLNSLVWNRAPKHHYKGPQVVKIAVMSAILYFNSGAASRQDVMEAANIPSGEFTFEGCLAKDKKRMSSSVHR